MTPVDLPAIKARAEKATAGPWEIIGAGEYVRGPGIIVAPDNGGINEADAEFIAASRTDIPALVAEVERLREERKEFMPTIDRLSELLNRTVNALKGDPPPLTQWSFHDVPELAAQAIANRDAAWANNDLNFHATLIALNETMYERNTALAVIEKVRELRNEYAEYLASGDLTDGFGPILTAKGVVYALGEALDATPAANHDDGGK